METSFKTFFLFSIFPSLLRVWYLSHRSFKRKKKTLFLWNKKHPPAHQNGNVKLSWVVENIEHIICIACWKGSISYLWMGLMKSHIIGTCESLESFTVLHFACLNYIYSKPQIWKIIQKLVSSGTSRFPYCPFHSCIPLLSFTCRTELHNSVVIKKVIKAAILALSRTCSDVWRQMFAFFLPLFRMSHFAWSILKR